MGLPARGIPKDCLSSLRKRRLFAFDIETAPNPDEHARNEKELREIKTDPRRSWVEWISIATEDGSWDWPIQRGEDFLEGLYEFFDNPEYQAIAQKAKFELQYAYLHLNRYRPSCQIICTLVAAWMIDERSKRYGLKLPHMGPAVLGRPMITYKEAMESRQSLFDAENEVWRQYCRDDSEAALKLWLKFRKILEKEGQLRIFLEIEMPCTQAIAEMDVRGVMTDTKLMADEVVKFENTLDEKRAKIISLSGNPNINVGSNEQMSELFFDKMGLPPGKENARGAKGLYSVAEEHIRPLIGKGHEIIDEYAVWKKANTDATNFWGKILRMGLKNDGVIFPKAGQVGTKTGRWAYTDPNITQSPRPDKSTFRKAIIARPGFVLVGGDYSQAELRVMAHRSKDPVLLEAYRNGLDVHQITADSLGCTRQLAKNINFGLIYGMSPWGLVYQLRNDGIELDIEDAKRYHKLFFRKYRGVWMYHLRVKKKVQKYGYVKDIIGRIRHLKEDLKINEDAAMRQAINSSIQISVGSLMKIAIRNIRSEMISRGLLGEDQFHLLFQVHDELIGEAPIEIAEECREIMHHEMVNALKIAVPIEADILMTWNWYDMKGSPTCKPCKEEGRKIDAISRVKDDDLYWACPDCDLEWNQREAA